ncbi:hypothetical protein Tco_0157248 [Tanacetum coccineum]
MVRNGLTLFTLFETSLGTLRLAILLENSLLRLLCGASTILYVQVEPMGDLFTTTRRAMIIALSWIYKVKLVVYGDVLKNMARSCSKGFRQEEV